MFTLLVIRCVAGYTTIRPVIHNYTLVVLNMLSLTFQSLTYCTDLYCYLISLYQLLLLSTPLNNYPGLLNCLGSLLRP